MKQEVPSPPHPKGNMKDPKEAADVQPLLRKAEHYILRARAVLYPEAPGQSLLCVVSQAHNYLCLFPKAF